MSIAIKINFFIRLCFKERNLRQIKEHPSREDSINIKKKSLFDSFTLVYTSLHLSSDSPVDTAPKLNVHKTFRRRLNIYLQNALSPFNLRPVYTGSSLFLK